MHRLSFKFMIVVLMLSSFLGQAFATSVNSQLVAHELEHIGMDASAREHDLHDLLDSHHQPATRYTAAPQDAETVNGVVETTHGGKFDDLAHQLLHAVHPLPLVSAPELPRFALPAQELARAMASVLPRLKSASDPLFRPPRISFAS